MVDGSILRWPLWRSNKKTGERSTGSKRLRMFIHFSSHEIDESVVFYPFDEGQSKWTLSGISLVNQCMVLSPQKSKLKQAFSWWWNDSKYVFEFSQNNNGSYVRIVNMAQGNVKLSTDSFFSLKSKTLNDNKRKIENGTVIWVFKGIKSQGESVSFTCYYV